MWLPYLTCARWLPRLGKQTKVCKCPHANANDVLANGGLLGTVFLVKLLCSAHGVLLTLHCGETAGL